MPGIMVTRVFVNLDRVLCLYALVLLSSCGGAAVGGRYSREFGCPERDSTVTPLGAGGYRVSGCGRVAVYTCRNRSACALESVEDLPTDEGGAHPGAWDPISR